MERPVIDLTGRQQPGYLTLAEAAGVLGCSTVDVFRLVRESRLRAVCTPATGFVVSISDVEQAKSASSG